MDKQILLKNFLEIPYDELEERNLKAKERSLTEDPTILEKEYRDYLQKEKRIKAVTICFSDIEGKFHMLDYDKQFLLSSADNLTFDGSSVRGFTSQGESDLRIVLDWSSILWLPSDIFGPGKVILFATIADRDMKQYPSDFRGVLKEYLKSLMEREKRVVNLSAEIEGFLVEGVNAEQVFDERDGFHLITSGGYYHSLPMDRLRLFIDACAEAQRAMGFKNEKDHPEVAPSQFEMNFSYTHALRACDQIQLYKLVCRQVANKMGLTATFLPKPAMGINGSGMHTNVSISQNGKNLFFSKTGEERLSPLAWDIISRILNHAPDICLILNPSVNAYRRLDPHFEAPNQIKVSPSDRGAMIRIPVANEKSSRMEVRSVAPDANPYLLIYTLLRAGLEGGKLQKDENKRERLRFLPGSISDAMKLYKGSSFVEKILGSENKEKYSFFKQVAADRSPKELGTRIKTSEVLFHHEVTNQALWNTF